jgi:hypothetical protein
MNNLLLTSEEARYMYNFLVMQQIEIGDMVYTETDLIKKLKKIMDET